MKTKNKLCSTCKTGRESLLLDPLSLECPYIERYKNGKCVKYVKTYSEKNRFCKQIKALLLKKIEGGESK